MRSSSPSWPARAPWSGTTAPPRTTPSAFPAWSRCRLRPAATWWLSAGRSLRSGTAPRSPSWPRAAPSRVLPARRSSARLLRSASGSQPYPCATRPPRSPRPGPDAVLACGPHGREVALFRALARLLPGGPPGRGVARPEPPFRSCSAVTRRASLPRCNGTRSSAPRRSSGRARRRCWPTPERPAAASSTTSPPRPTPVALVATRCLELDPRDRCARRGAFAPRPSSAPSSSIPKAASSAATAWRSSAGKGGAGTCSPVEWLVLRGAVPLDLGS